MRVALLPSDQEACGAYRVLWPAQVLEALEQIELVASFEDAELDVIVLQRPTSRDFVGIVPHIQARGIAVVVEIDDDLERLPVGHAQYPFFHGKSNPIHSWRNLRRICALADLVTGSTPALSRYASHGRFALLRNCVPAYYLDIRADRDGRTVGWGGATSIHPGDLQATRGGVGEALKRADARFLAIGDNSADAIRSALDITDEIEVEATDRLPLGEYVQKIAQLDVGIAPLADNEFSRGKSALKLLEYMALGVPWVASLTDEYKLLAEWGSLAAPRARNWRRAVSELLEAENLRGDRTLAGRDIVAERFTLENNAWRWAEAWAQALEHRRAQKPSSLARTR